MWCAEGRWEWCWCEHGCDARGEHGCGTRGEHGCDARGDVREDGCGVMREHGYDERREHGCDAREHTIEVKHRTVHAGLCGVLDYISANYIDVSCSLGDVSSSLLFFKGSSRSALT